MVKLVKDLELLVEVENLKEDSKSELMMVNVKLKDIDLELMLEKHENLKKGSKSELLVGDEKLKLLENCSELREMIQLMKDLELLGVDVLQKQESMGEMLEKVDLEMMMMNWN